MNLSLCIITRNEEANLARCLRSVASIVDEIVLVDSGSTDGTLPMAREFGARIHHQEWLGYVGQKNYAISLAAHEWVLSLDADEEVSSDLCDELLRWKNGPEPQVSGYSMPRCVFYEGRWIRHGDWYPDRLVRLFRKSRSRFAGGKVHERLEVEGPIREFSGEIYHYSFKNGDDHLARGEYYARLWAETQVERGRTAGPLAPPLRAAYKWFRGYILRAGFLDGRQGWEIAARNAREVYLKYQLLRKMPRRQ